MRLVVPGCISDARSIPGLRVLVLAIAMALYLSMGASVFQAIEGPLERETAERVARLKMDFLRDHPCLTGSYFYWFYIILHPSIQRIRNDMEYKLC
ncbi:hypothetical protein evm_000447 [Chilo suppressalis]|nr:hypothetical protein evm_000394 [Chilo suppressalis]RVE55080.1 hypothetical protein evm_000447 [Chilo suppressalis]